MKYTIYDIISVLRLEHPPRDKTNYYITCPCCDYNSRSKHLNINLEKGVFRCPKCGVSGGKYDLYTLYTGVPKEDVYETLENKSKPFRTSYKPQRRETIATQRETVKEYPITDVETRHATYAAFLSKLSLANDHKENLLNRGLKEDEIERLGYKTTPVMGATSIARQLQTDGVYLAGVPGFYRTEKDEWTFSHDNRGILIPVRDCDGRIQGLQVRLDKTEKRKFRWFSSTDRKDGCRSEGWTHLAGEVVETIIITEGPMKADVINALTGYSVLAVPGVQSLKHLEVALSALKERGLKDVMTAFDMDFLMNPHVQNGFDNLLQLLDDNDLTFGTYLWDSRYKGLDDYIWQSVLNKTRN